MNKNRLIFKYECMNNSKSLTKTSVGKFLRKFETIAVLDVPVSPTSNTGRFI